MPSTVHQIQDNPGINWLAVVRILVLQVLMFLGIIGAIVCYLDWSSEAAWAEFSSANRPVLSDPGHRLEVQNLVRIVGEGSCARAI
jgi:Ni,Fe-hydrogenase I cytochrome b subunit